MAFPKAFALHKVGIADTAVREALAAPAGVLEDAARWHWMAEYIVGTRTDLDDELIASATVDELSKLVDADLAARGAAPAQPRDDAVFVVWWSDHMPNSTEADAWAEWCALRSNQPAAQVQEDAKDAARYRFLRNGEWRDTELEPFIRLQLNALWDSKIDAAIAAQQGTDAS